MNEFDKLKMMTVEEKAALVSGTNFMYTNSIPRLGIPSLCMSDGPHGLRKQSGTGNNGVTQSEPATSFPTAAATASGWNPENLRRMGEAIGRECRYYGVHTLLGPGVNIKRNPLCGRNFEYFSEDPYLTGVLGAAEVEGIQSQGVGACLKHFALNNSENYRFMGNSIASEHTIRNLYLKPFEYIVRHARPAAMMCAYNQINGVLCSENKWLLTDVLRREWGYKGVVMTDWGAVRDRVEGIKAGLDLEMPGDTAICRRKILDAVQDGTLSVEELDEACGNILRWVDRWVQPADKEAVDWEQHHRLAAEIAADCAVLMENDGTLPLTGDRKLHMEGPLYSVMRYQGSGSSMIHPTSVTTVRNAFEERGVREYPIDECDVILVFAGLTDLYESEGQDRENMRLPEDQIELIDRMCATGKKVVVVLFGGSVVELPFNHKVNAILNMFLPGQNGGTAAAQLLFGEKNPSGKLAETWPLRYEDVPGHERFGRNLQEVYSEGTEVGYRYYGKHNVTVRYPFGYGLSYTTFAHSAWEKDGNVYSQTVTNTGERYGGEVVQLYVNGELRGFRKIYLQPHENRKVSIAVDETPEIHWLDTYTVPDLPPVLPITPESRFTDLRRTFMGRILFNSVLSVAHRQRKKAEKMPDGPEKENAVKGAIFLKRILESNSLRCMSMSAGKSFPWNYAEGFADLANGHWLKGIKHFLSPVSVPELPSREKK